MAKEPKSVVVAVAKVYDGVKVDAVSPEEVKVAAGDAVELKFTFDLEEASPEREEYRFVLDSSLGSESKEPEEARFKDSWGTPESVMGYVSHTYEVKEAGKFECRFSAMAEYSRRKWFKKDAERRSVEDRVEGSLWVRAD